MADLIGVVAGCIVFALNIVGMYWAVAIISECLAEENSGLSSW